MEKSWYSTASKFHTFNFSSSEEASRCTRFLIACSSTARTCGTSHCPRGARRSKRWRLQKASCCSRVASPQTVSRKNFGALLLGAYEHGKLHYVGKVGTGFDATTLAALHKRFQPLVSGKTALVDPPREREVTYLRPQLIAQISYQELTADRKLRQPVYLGLRDDKRAKDVTLPGTVT